MKPKFVLSKSKVLEQFDVVNKMADVVSYSSKTNPLVSSILEENTDSLFSIHLVSELKNVKDLSRVVFLAQAWTAEEVMELISKGVKWFIVDNESDLDTFLSCDLPKDVTLLLRLKLKENTLRTERYFVFGMSSEVVNKRLKEIDKKIRLGVHFHRKTQNMAEWNLQYEFEQMIDPEVISKISVVNIGGGLPSEYANTNIDVLPSIFRKVEEFREWLVGKRIKLMIEPGRFIAAPAGKLITSIIGVHGNNIIVNASVYNSDLDALIVPVKLKVEGELSSGGAYVIKGLTPCSLDLFRYRVYLENPKVGDEIVFLNAGAYNFTTNFCDLDTIETEIIK